MPNQTLRDKTATTALAAGDIFYVLRDPSGTPLDRKVTLQSMIDSFAAFDLSAMDFYADLGTALLPSHSFTGDTNTGMWSPAADTIAFSTGGTERYRVLSSGNIGIGATTAPARLSITPSAFGSTNIAQTLLTGLSTVLGATAGSYLYPVEFQAFNGSNVGRLQFAPYRRIAGSGWQGTGFRLQMAVDGAFTDGSKSYVEIGGADSTTSGGGTIALGTAGVDRLFVTNAGDVGIGTITPTARLDVAGSVRIGSTGTTIQRVISTTTTLDFPSIAANSTAQLTITVTGAAVGDSVALGAPSTIEAGLTWSGFVSAANTVTVRLHNTAGSAIDPASATWRATIHGF